MSNLISLASVQAPSGERVSNVLSAASALISGAVLMLALAIAF